MRRVVIVVIALALVGLSGFAGWQLKSGPSAHAADWLEIPFTYRLASGNPDLSAGSTDCSAPREGKFGTYSQIVARGADDTVVNVVNLGPDVMKGTWSHKSATDWTCTVKFTVSVPLEGNFVTLYLDDQRITTVFTYDISDLGPDGIVIPEKQ